MSRNFVFVLDESVETGQSVVRRWSVGGWLQLPLGPLLILGIRSFSVLESCMKHWYYMFLCIAARQCYERSRKNLELGPHRWTTSDDCSVLEGWIESRMHE